MEDYEARFNAIMKDNQMDEWEALSLDELLIVLAATNAAAAQLSNMLIDFFDAEDEANLDLPVETGRLIRELFKATDAFLDDVIENQEREYEDEDDDEDD